jgi:hypothetical protein
MKLGSVLLTSFLALIVVTSDCQAWNATGHMTIALIAYRRLDASTRSKVDAILRSHPAYTEFKGKQPTNFADEGAWVFMMASTWPDVIKDRNNPFHATYDPDDSSARPGSFHKGIHDVEHFVDQPFEQGGTTGKAPGPRTILTYLPENLAKLKMGGDDKDMAVALSWIIHLMGDLHQPLHCTSRFSPEFPDGDQGGNLFVVMPPEGNRPVALHAYWDGMLGSTKNAPTINRQANSILGDDDLKREKLDELKTNTTPKDWAKECFQLAVDFVYQGGDLPGIPQHVLHEDSDTSIPVLPNRYRANAMDIADRQAALASFRLADQISDALR